MLLMSVLVLDRKPSRHPSLQAGTSHESLSSCLRLDATILDVPHVISRGLRANATRDRTASTVNLSWDSGTDSAFVLARSQVPLLEQLHAYPPVSSRQHKRASSGFLPISREAGRARR